VSVESWLAESEHMEILRRGPRAWNAWRDENPSQVPNLDDAALSLGERQLGPINGGPINLRSARMQRAFLRSAALSEADLEAADMSGANLSYARLDRANLKAADLSGAVLDYADFTGAVLDDTNLSGASLQHVQNLTQAQINNSICSAATILPAHLENPGSRMEIAKEGKRGGPLSPDQRQSTFVSKIV
jgi:Pentapeptide repeats (8 copies)